MANYFMFHGPNSPLGHGSIHTAMRFPAQYTLIWVKKIATEDSGSIVIKDRAVDDHNAYTQEFIKRIVWSAECSSWYKNGKDDGKVTAMYAGSVLYFKVRSQAIRRHPKEDFN